jgi:transposase
MYMQAKYPSTDNRIESAKAILKDTRFFKIKKLDKEYNKENV